MKIDVLQMNNLQGKEITLRKTEIQESKLKKLDDVCSEFAKLVFLFDVSGSMTEHVAESFTEQYLWTPEILADIRARVATAVNRFNIFCADATMTVPPLTKEEDELIRLRDSDYGPFGELLFTADDEEIQKRIVRHDMIGFFGIEVNLGRVHEAPPSRIDLVKKLAKSELENRFKKFPKAHVAVIPFGSYPHVIFDDGEPDALWPELEKLNCSMPECGGGTDIMGGIRSGMEVCRAKPSPVGIHHFIVVSDGEDSCHGIANWVPALKASGVVLDYIHIGDRDRNENLAAACKALGGEHVTVNTVKDFERKFVAAMNRLLMPPA